MILLFLRFSVDSPFRLKRLCEFHSFVYFLASRLWFVALNPGFVDYHQRRRNCFQLRLNSVKLDYNSLSCACWSKPSYKQYLMQDIIHAVFWAVYCLSSLALRCSSWGPFVGHTGHSLNQCLLVSAKVEASPSPCLSYKRSFLSVHDFPFKNQNRVTDRYWSFSIFLKFANTPAFTRSQNKILHRAMRLSTCRTALVYMLKLFYWSCYGIYLYSRPASLIL